MTCDPIWTVWCDRCGTWCQETDSRAPAARANARRRGWVRRDRQDLCPQCARQGSS